MKLNTVDDNLLLYVDNEISAAQKILVEEKLSNDKDYAFQFSLLMQTKVDASEIISYPNKKELYRHTERVVYFPVWMRVAVAVILLLFGSLFFLINSNKEVPDKSFVTTTPAANPSIKKNSISEQKTISVPQQKEEPVIVKAPAVKKSGTAILKSISVQDKIAKDISNDLVLQKNNDVAAIKREVAKLQVSRIPTEINSNDVAVNKTIAHTSVTSPLTVSYYNQNDPAEPAATNGDFEIEKTTRGKGFFRKVSRFIQRNTGIGTVNADNELLIGAVALKLK